MRRMKHVDSEPAVRARPRPTAQRRVRRIRYAATLLLALLLVVALPDALHACPVCFDSSAENRRAFLVTAIFMSLLPLGMVAGAGLWVRRRTRQIDEEMGEGGPEA